MDPEPRPVPLDTYLGQPAGQCRLLARLYAAGAPLTLLDIGGCEGEDSIRYARQFPSARIFTFEPLPHNQAIIRENFRRYGVDRAELVPVALSNAEGSATFHVSTGKPRERFCGEDWNYGNKSSSLLPPAAAEPMHGWIEFKQSIIVPTQTLDGFLRSRGIPRVDFIHMDVQGAELLVLEGAARALQHTSAVWMEVADHAFYKGQPLRSDVTAFMWRQGFFPVHETRNLGEGDQFYVNLRHARCWPIFLSSTIRQMIRRIRARLRPMKPSHLLRRMAGWAGLFVCRTTHPSLRYLRLPPANGLAYALHQAFPSLNGLRLVQIGANDGLRCDPVHDFIVRYGWAGLLVEPRAVFATALRRLHAERPGIRIAQVALAGENGTRMVHFIDPDLPALPDWAHGLASLDRSRLEEACKSLNLGTTAIRTEPVDCLTWDSLPCPHPWNQTDLLVIDAEGLDIELLRLWNWEAARPRVVHFEHACCPASDWLDLIRRLRPLGYEMVTTGPDTTLFLPHHREDPPS